MGGGDVPPQDVGGEVGVLLAGGDVKGEAEAAGPGRSLDPCGGHGFAGAQLRPVLDAIFRWGVRYMTEPAEGDEFHGHWLAFPASFFLHDRDPDGPPVSIELRTASSPVVIEVSGGSARLRLGTAAAPDLVLQGEPQLILALLSGRLTAPEVADLGLQVSGDASVLHRVLPEPAATS
jgi:hypothetical protein